MNCERFQTAVNDLAREPNRGPQQGSPVGAVLVEANERARALEHAAECDACALIWEEQRSLTTGLRTLAGEMKSLAAPPQLEEKVLAAFRERGNVRPAVRPVVRPFHAPGQLPRYWIAAIAALLLIVFGIVVVRSGVLSRSQPQQASKEVPDKKAPSNAQTGVVERSPAVETVKDETEPPAPRPRRNPKYLTVSGQSRGGRGRYGNVTASLTSIADAGNNQGNDEIATAFFPIVYGTRPNLQEGGQLLRVELPRAAVARFGLPVNMDGTSERVKADVLVGADGLAQAIRFVH